ncbi:MAG: HDIG domain-containing protein [Candidatus Omnitrophica bacterium]|nr:HDIG domain-containing protein [Candidatus Omnitrophota bacterium]
MNDKKTKKNSLVVAVVIFLVLTGYCYIAGLSMVIPLLVVFYGFHLVVFKKLSVGRLVQIGLLLTLILALSYGMSRYYQFNPYLIPVTSIAMLTMLLFGDIQLAFMMAFLSAVLASLVVGMDLDYMIVIFLGGLSGAYAVREARTRATLLTAGFVVGAVQILAYFLLHPQLTKAVFAGCMGPLALNGLLSAGAVLATLKVFEILFGELTNFSLLELSDSLHQPLLKRLAFEAPGTYHHSLVVSNLAGAAADAIGTNALLVRVGAYYHDVGKLVKPEYFNENQSINANKHDDLEPSMSRLVILNHVKEGVELARKHHLSEKLVAFIEQHHGTSLIHYFYQKALEDGAVNELGEETYRYPGPRPQSREVALVMLADSVEGATRSIDEHTPTRIDEVVRKIINNKFIDGQLDECNLTLREIETICESFSRTLSAMYHVRVKYPNPRKDAH